MEYITSRFENTPEGLRQKDAYTGQVAAQGFRIISEEIEQGHIKGQEQCCWALVCLPGIFLARRAPAVIVVTYGREDKPKMPSLITRVKCSDCGAEQATGGKFCEHCGTNLLVNKPLPEGMKKCPFCAEHIQIAAKKCRFCGEFLDRDDKKPGDATAN